MQKLVSRLRLEMEGEKLCLQEPNGRETLKAFPSQAWERNIEGSFFVDGLLR